MYVITGINSKNIWHIGPVSGADIDKLLAYLRARDPRSTYHKSPLYEIPDRKFWDKKKEPEKDVHKDIAMAFLENIVTGGDPWGAF